MGFIKNQYEVLNVLMLKKGAAKLPLIIYKFSMLLKKRINI
jgi:hypothetical protein